MMVVYRGTSNAGKTVEVRQTIHMLNRGNLYQVYENYQDDHWSLMFAHTLKRSAIAFAKKL